MGRNDVEFIEKYASFWRVISNKDETVNSAYGNLLFNEKNEYGLSQWQWAFQTLKNDKDSRQAIMLFNKPQYQWIGNKDVICTLNAIFNIRDNKLNFSVSMRSNDAILGTPTDVAFFCLLQQQMLKLLKPYYPDLELGTYTHIANSYHIYDRHFILVDEIIGNDFIEKSFPEIGWNFINEHGDPTEDLQKLMMEAEANKISDYSEDPLYNWIAEKLTDI
jgi:thymidylate synthase